MRNIILISHGEMAIGVKSSLEMIIGKQSNVHTVILKADSDNIQFEKDLKKQMNELKGESIIIADLLGGTPCNVALKNYVDDENVEIIAGMSLPLAIEATLNQESTVDELIDSSSEGTVNVKKQVEHTKVPSENASDNDLSKYEKYKGKANIVNVRIDERLIHGQVAGIWSTSLDTQRIVVINDDAASNELQKSSLRMAAPTAMRLSVLTIKDAVRNIQAGKYGQQRIFLLFKNPTDVLRYTEAGGLLESINVGNMSYKDGSREVTKSIQVTEQEEIVFEKLSSKGINITAQLVPNDPSIDFMKKLKN